MLSFISQISEEAKKASIRTYTGILFCPLSPDINQINILDISHALSNKCRYTGHSQKFYSVGQHSILVSQHSNEEDRKHGLLHDAAEAYLSDIPTPIKYLKEMEWWREVETNLERVIFTRFGLSPERPHSVHVADKVLLVTEKRDLVPGSTVEEKYHQYLPLILEKKIKSWKPEKTKLRFLEQYIKLWNL